MEAPRYIAKKGNMEFFFTVFNRQEKQVDIVMYSTPYALIKQDENWTNSSGNKCQMSKELIHAVVAALK